MKKKVKERATVVSVTIDYVLMHRLGRLKIPNFSEFVREAIKEKLERMERGK